MPQSRRDFLKSALGATTVVSLAPVLPAFLQNAAVGSPQGRTDSDTVLIVMQLSGGNDGLNTVVPFDDDVYGRSRTTLRLTKEQVIPIDSDVGFHPQMPGFKKMLDDGHMTIVQGVGYPNSDRNHEVATRDWHTARPGDAACQTGWIGRTVDLVDRAERADVPAALVGTIAPPFALNAEGSVVPSIRTLHQLQFKTPHDDGSALPGDGDGQSLLDLVRRGTSAAQYMSDRVSAVLAKSSSAAAYPPFKLAGQLQNVSQLMQADLGIRIYFVELGGDGFGGFDNHANQRDNHAALLSEMSASIAAFVDDLHRQKILDRALLMTFSEFGRTVTESGRRGTNHGAAAPMFLAGGALKGGLFGKKPDLTDLDQDAPKPDIDFRRVYATALQNWLGFDAKTVLGKEYQTLDLFA